MHQIKGNKILNFITEIFIFTIVILFPLCVDSTGFFRILECKYRYFLIINSIYICSIIITLLYYLLFEKKWLLKGVKLHKIHFFVLAFLFINVISTFFSPFFNKYNLFIGVGRAEGLISITLYCLSFINVTLFGKFNKRYVLYFSISSILLNLISILQYIGFNPFNMYQDGIGTHNVSFIGTIGNIDFVSALYCILITISVAAYIFLEDNKLYEKIIYLVSIYMGFFILEILNVLSGILAFAITLILISPFILTNSKKFSKFLIIIAIALLGYFTNLTINPTFYYNLGKIVLEFQINKISITLFILAVIFIILSYILSKRDFNLSKNNKIIRSFYLLMVIFILFALILIYFINFTDGFLYEIHEILHGNLNDDFGTYRLFLWKRSISLVKDYPIIGTGPDTFAVRFMAKYTNDVIALGDLTINDTAANNYLTILVNTGILGITSYLIFLIYQIVYTLKKQKKYSIIFFTAFICFMIQDFFNLWVVMVIPIFWILMSLMFLSTKEMEEKNE